jgi:hypothetical protein
MRLVLGFLSGLLLAGVAFGGDWTTSSFEDFRKGEFFDAGSNLYVSQGGRVQMINRWDLNGDGNLDIVIPSGHAHTEKEDTFVYLNNGQDIDGRSLIKLPANGSTGGLLRDLNKDGYDDLVVCNGDNGMTPYTDLYIYWGGADGFSVQRRMVLPAQRSAGVVAGDFDGDGWIDLALACKFQEGDEIHPKGDPMSLLYWNGPKGFNPKERSTFSFDGNSAQAVVAGDLNGDGVDDLVMVANGKTNIFYSPKTRFDGTAKHTELPIEARAGAMGDVNHDGHKDLALCTKPEVLILLGKADGTLESEPIHLPAKRPAGVVLCDVNKDGLDDVAIANYAGEDGATWVKSYIYLSDGKDFKSNKPIELPTMGARAISAGDLNGDGYPELVISNEKVTNQRSIPSCVFWNDKGSFRQGDHTELPTEGSVANAIGDVNHDGKPDVVFFNFEGHFRDGASKSLVFWGDGTRNYSPQRMLELDTHYITSIAHADLDDDGYVDLLMTQSRFVNGANEDIFDSLLIYWGSERGFDRMTRLCPEKTGGGIRIADLNRDGYLDIIVGAHSPDLTNPARSGMPIYWGSANGYSQRNRSLIAATEKGGNSRVPMVADLNKDGYLDLASAVSRNALTIWWGGEKGFSDERTTELKHDRDLFPVFVNAADLNKDGWLDLILPVRESARDNEVSSYIYYGSPNGYSNDHRVELPTIGTYESSVADLDKDGWLDIVVTSYKGNTRANWPSYIYWGSSDGFTKRPRTELPTTGSSGVETADYDGDGWIDILFSNHRADGSTEVPGPNDHRVPSMLYWGGPEGFSPKRRWEAIGNGPHAMNVRDVGNTYDRGLYEDYMSEAHPIPNGQHPTRLKWKAQTPHGARVQFQVRYAADAEALKSARWQGPKDESSWYDKSDAALSPPKDARVTQYRARLTTPNGGPTAYLESVTIQFE